MYTHLKDRFMWNTYYEVYNQIWYTSKFFITV